MDKICGNCRHYDNTHKMCTMYPKMWQEVLAYMAVDWDDLGCHQWSHLHTRLDYFMGRGRM